MKSSGFKECESKPFDPSSEVLNLYDECVVMIMIDKVCPKLVTQDLNSDLPHWLVL